MLDERSDTPDERREKYVDTIALLLEDHLRGQTVEGRDEPTSVWDLLVHGQLADARLLNDASGVDEQLFEGTRDALAEGKPPEDISLIQSIDYLEVVARLLERAIEQNERDEHARRQALDEHALLAGRLLHLTPDQLHTLRRDLERQRQRG